MTTQHTPEQASRERFEQFICRAYGLCENNHLLEQDSNCYINDEISGMWCAWQAGRADIEHQRDELRHQVIALDAQLDALTVAAARDRQQRDDALSDARHIQASYAAACDERDQLKAGYAELLAAAKRALWAISQSPMLSHELHGELESLRIAITKAVRP